VKAETIFRFISVNEIGPVFGRPQSPGKAADFLLFVY